MKKNILISANTLCIGGIEKSLINLLKNIDLKKYNIDLILEHATGELLNEVPTNINILEYKPYNLKIKPIQKILNLLKQTRYKLTLKNAYDISICYATYSYPDNFITRLASKNRMLFVHSDYTKLYNEKELLEFFNTRHITEFNKIIFVSNESKNNLIKYYPNIVYKSIVINNIIDIEKIKKLSEEKIENVFNKKDINLLFVGRLEESSKNIMFQLSKIKDLKKIYNNIKLYILGNGPAKEKYIKYIDDNKLNDNIIMLGQKSNPYPYIKKCDYLLLTSNYEGYPVIFNEAITLKKDIISTIKISDNYTCIGDNFGFLISKDNFVLEIQKILDNKLHNNNKINIEDINNKRINDIEELIN